LTTVAAAAYGLDEPAGDVAFVLDKLFNLAGDGAVSLNGAGYTRLLLTLILLIGTLLFLCFNIKLHVCWILRIIHAASSVMDPEPGSGTQAFLTPLPHWTRDPESFFPDPRSENIKS
jgi:hypothetical protein